MRHNAGDKMNHRNSMNFRKYFPNRNENKKNDIYDFFISSDESVIYKKNKNRPSKFKELLQNKVKKDDFEDILSGEGIIEDLRPNVVKGFDLETDGSHKSEFIHGYRLDLISDYELSESIFFKILDECKKLLQKLEFAASEENLFGDWALHNLVFSLKYGCIMNVDLEGFVTYNPLPEWANYDVISNWNKSIEVSKFNHQSKKE